MRTAAKKNFGFGRSIGYAIRNVLLYRFGDGRFGTRYTHRHRATFFVDFLRSRSIRDLRDVTHETVLSYARQLKDSVDDGYLAISTAQNRLSSVNVLMETARCDKACAVSPRQEIGARDRIRREPPADLCAETVWAAAATARDEGYWDLAMALVLCRFCGTRIREAALLDIRKAVRSTVNKGAITIVHGSKGGRAKSIPREIVVPRRLATWLADAKSSLASPNLIPVGQTFSAWYQDVYRRFRPIALQHQLANGFHDLRASYACERYELLTGFEAPCVVGRRLADKTADLSARETIAEELGHGRVDVIGSYIGSRR